MSASNSGRYHIGTVSKLTGISSHTIRVWERRYSAVEPERSPGGTREYSDADVDKLILLRSLNESGQSIGQIAHLDTSMLRDRVEAARRRGLLPARAPSAQAAVIEAVLHSITELDVAAAERSLNEATSQLSPLTMVFDVIAPLVAAIGTRWQDGEMRISSEHAATAVLRTVLGTFLSRQILPKDAPMAVAATISGELHELGALMASFVAAARGWRITYLGPNLPGAEIRHVLDKTSAKLLLLSAVQERTEQNALLLRDLRGNIPKDVRVLIGGRAAREYSDVFDVSERVGDLRDLHDRLGSIGSVVGDSREQSSNR